MSLLWKRVMRSLTIKIFKTTEILHFIQKMVHGAFDGQMALATWDSALEERKPPTDLAAPLSASSFPTQF